MSLGENLKRLRVEKGLNQGELAKLCGLVDVNISHFETGYRTPMIDNIRKLRKGLDCSFDDLLVDNNGA